jgi:hypothetical protein
MTRPPPDPFLPEDVGSIAIVSLYRGLRRAGLSMVEAAVLVGAQTVMMHTVAQAQQDPPQV